MGYIGAVPAAAALTSADITDGIIIDADIKADAAIALSKTALVGGTGITLATNTLNVDASQGHVTTVGALNAGSITSGFTSIDVGAGAITTTGALSIASMGTNWTNAGRTVADMGIATTIDINGGTVDGAIIGANAAAAGTFAALVSTTFAPTDDITLAADKSLNLPQGANIDFTDVIANDGIDDHDAQGVIFTFNAGATVTPFSPVYLAEDNLVEEANATAIATMPCIGVSINTSDVTVGNPIKVLVMGLIRDDGAVYVSTTVGTMTSTAPSGEDNVVQVIGHSIEDDALFVQPCLTTIEHTG